MQKIIMLLSVVAALSSFGPLTADADAFYESGNLTINRWHVHLSKHAFNAESGQTGVLVIQQCLLFWGKSTNAFLKKFIRFDPFSP